MKAENATNDFVLSHIKVFFYNLFLKLVEVSGLSKQKITLKDS